MGHRRQRRQKPDQSGRTSREPDNERIAYRVAGLFGIDHIEYRIGRAQVFAIAFTAVRGICKT